jgi:hypothetical protein
MKPKIPSRRIGIPEAEDLSREILRAELTKRTEALKKEEYSIADAVFMHVVGKKNLEIMASLPETFFEKRSDVNVISRSGRRYSPRYSEARSVPDVLNRWHNNGSALNLSDKIKDRLDCFLELSVKLAEDRAALLDKTKATILGIRTTSALREAWPEAAKLLKDEPKATLPAVRVEDLKASLKAAGLQPQPTTKKAA